MKLKLAWIILIGVFVVVMWVAHTRRSNAPGQGPDLIVATTNIAPATASGTDHQRKVTVQTGQERMSNAVRCMSYIADLSNKMPKGRGTDKPLVMTMAGVFFFDDCLMAKMSNGHIFTTTNELLQNYSNAVAKVFTNGVPDDLARGFYGSFDNRNNLQISLEDQYKMIEKLPGMTRTLRTLNSALQEAGISDAGQSDLKEMCFGLSTTRTTSYLMYGPQSDTPVPEEYQAMSDSVDKILIWRLTNMFGLDQGTAQTFVKSISLLPIDSISHAGLQPPAFIQ